MLSNRTRSTALFLAVLITCAGAVAQASTTGVIAGLVKSEEAGTALAGVNVIVSNTTLSTVTDSAGRFIFTNVPPGDYEVRAELVGYSTSILGSVQVSMDSTAQADFSMKQEVTEEETVVVTRPRPMITKEAVNTLNLITAQEEPMTRLDPANVRTATGLLSSLPGVVSEPDGSGQVHLRGGRTDQIGWYLEGIPITDPNTGMFGTNLFTTGVSKFQAYTGGFSAEYGNAISGVLNEVKKTGAALAGANLNLESGSDAFWNAFLEAGGGTADQFNYYMGASVEKTDLDGPIVKNQEYIDAVAKLVWPFKKDNVTVLAMQGKLNGGLDAYHETGDMGEPTPYEKDFMDQRYNVTAVTWSHNFSPSRFITVRPYYLETKIDQNIVGTYGTYANIFSERTGLQLGYTSQMGERNLVKIGGSMMASENHYYVFPGFPYYSSDVDTSQTDFYVTDQVRFGKKWTADLGLRYESITYDRTGNAYVDGAGYSGEALGDVTRSETTPRLGLSYAVDDRTCWKMSWGEYCKFVPSSSVQRTYFDPDLVLAEGYPPLEAMTASLGSTDPQKSTSMELSYERQVSDSVAWRITPFYTRYENLSDLYMDYDTGLSEYANLGDGKSSGVELYVRKKMSDNWRGWISYTYQKTRANRADLGMVDDMYYAPWDQKQTFSLITDYKIGKCSHGLRADFGSGRADRGDPTLQQRAGASFVMSYNFSAKLPKGSGIGDTFYLNVFNVFNNHQTLQYSWTSGERTRDSWVPSRTVSMGVSSTF